MSEFLHLFVSTLNEKRNLREKRILEKSNVLPKDIMLIVLDYSLFGDNWTKPKYFDDLILHGDYWEAKKIFLDGSLSIENPPRIVANIQLFRSTDNSNDEITSGQISASIFDIYTWLLGDAPF